jgi:hypothetical protein
MFRPFCLLSAFASVFLGGAATAAGDAPAKIDAAKEADPAATRQTASPLISSMISAGLPKYGELKTPEAPAAPAETVPRVAETSSATIVRLPAVIVRDRKLPDKSEVMTKQEMTRQGMETYIGPETGLDRGFLNLFTLADLWHHLPLVGRYELVGFETNEERGLRLYQEARRREELEELNHLSTMGQKADSAAGTLKASDK